jgi:hypothetical protein
MGDADLSGLDGLDPELELAPSPSISYPVRVGTGPGHFLRRRPSFLDGA